MSLGAGAERRTGGSGRQRPRSKLHQALEGRYRQDLEPAASAASSAFSAATTSRA